MNKENYPLVKKVRINPLLFNVLCTLLCIPLILLYLFVLFFHPWYKEWPFGENSFIFTLVLSGLSCVIIHELLHGLAAKWWGGFSWKDLRFGVKLKYGTAYCNLERPIQAWAFKRVCLFPGLVLSVISGVACLFWLSEITMTLFIFNLAVGLGDYWYCFVIRDLPDHYLIQDNSEKLGFDIYAPTPVAVPVR